MSFREIRDLGPALKMTREEMDLSAKDLAAAVGVAPSYLSEIETGKRPLTDAFAERVATAMKITNPDLNDRLQAWGENIREAFRGRVQAETNRIGVDPLAERDSIVRESPTPYNFKPHAPADTDLLIEWLISRMTPVERAGLLRECTEAAINGDPKAPGAARALLALIEKIPNIPKP